jgi:hypothetical protein
VPLVQAWLELGLVPRSAELLVSSKNTAPALNKHRGFCEIQKQHERPGKELLETAICRRIGTVRAISEVPQGQGQALDGGQCLGLQARAGGNKGERSKQTLVDCPGGGPWPTVLNLSSKRPCLGGIRISIVT